MLWAKTQTRFWQYLHVQCDDIVTQMNEKNISKMSYLLQNLCYKNKKCGTFMDATSKLLAHGTTIILQSFPPGMKYCDTFGGCRYVEGLLLHSRGDR